MAPLSKNALFLRYGRNPLPQLFQQSLNIGISSGDPLKVCFTKERLIEEYSVARQMRKLSSTDMWELAHDSVTQSGRENKIKSHWIENKLNFPEGKNKCTRYSGTVST
jgi:AMP deaminase